MEYALQKRVVLEDICLYGIEMKQNTSNLLSSWVYSVSIFAISQCGRVPVELSYVSETPAFTIIGQTARANFRAGVDGDLRHTDPIQTVLSSFIQSYP